MPLDDRFTRLGVKLKDLDAERAGQTRDAYLCRWGCGIERPSLPQRDGHERNAHSALFVGPLAHEVNKHRAEEARLFAMLNERADEADALRTALDRLLNETQWAVDDLPVEEPNAKVQYVRTALRAAIASGEAALKGAAK